MPIPHRTVETKLSAFIDLDETDRAALAAALNQPAATVARNRDYIREGDDRTTGFVVMSGWAARYKELADGRRQILSLIVPGDVVGLFAPVAPTATAGVLALSELEVVPLPSDNLVSLFRSAPRVAAALAWAAAREQEILAEHLVSLGRRTARERTAHFYLELWARLRLRGLANGKRLHVPATQTVIGDILGLSVVHVNRTLRQLQSEGVLEVRRDRVELADVDALQRIAGFSDDFLLPEPAPLDTQRLLDRASDTQRRPTAGAPQTPDAGADTDGGDGEDRPPA